jgi:nucleoside 2-deoxyribosyltransferase
MKIYLAHALKERARGKEAQKLFASRGFEVINPFDKEPHLEGKTAEQIWTFGEKEKALQIICTDLEAIDSCDCVIALIPDEQISIGIYCEIMYAFMSKKIVISITDKYKGHPWVLGLSDVVLPTEKMLPLSHGMFFVDTSQGGKSNG